jgi:adenosylcobinamide-GDP ribazoletransferase
VLLAKFAALASLADGLRWPAALLMPLAGRTAIVVHMALLRYARPEGLGGVFYPGNHRGPALFAVGLLAGVSWWLLGPRGLVVCGVCLGGALLLAGYVYRKLGGLTGDTLGAVCEIVETLPALTLAVWPLPEVR